MFFEAKSARCMFTVDTWQRLWGFGQFGCRGSQTLSTNTIIILLYTDDSCWQRLTIPMPSFVRHGFLLWICINVCCHWRKPHITWQNKGKAGKIFFGGISFTTSKCWTEIVFVQSMFIKTLLYTCRLVTAFTNRQSTTNSMDQSLLFLWNQQSLI